MLDLDAPDLVALNLVALDLGVLDLGVLDLSVLDWPCGCRRISIFLLVITFGSSFVLKPKQLFNRKMAEAIYIFFSFYMVSPTLV